MCFEGKHCWHLGLHVWKMSLHYAHTCSTAILYLAYCAVNKTGKYVVQCMYSMYRWVCSRMWVIFPTEGGNSGTACFVFQFCSLTDRYPHVHVGRANAKKNPFGILNQRRKNMNKSWGSKDAHIINIFQVSTVRLWYYSSFTLDHFYLCTNRPWTRRWTRFPQSNPMLTTSVGSDESVEILRKEGDKLTACLV